MRIAFLCICIAATTGVMAQDGEDEVTAEKLLATGLPLVSVTTIDGEEPSCDYIYPPEGSNGLSIANATKVPGRVVVIQDADTLYDSGEYVKGSSGMTIKIRGNTSAWEDQKPYKIKLQKKADMLCRGDKKYNDKNWVLLHELPFNLCQEMSRYVCRKVRPEWEPWGQYVNVMMNDKYRGLYYLSESIERNADSRIDVDKDHGYIVECDSYWWAEDLYFETYYTTGSPYLRYTFKYPDSEDVTDEQKAYISSAVSDAERGIHQGGYANYIDVASWASWLLTHDILGTLDGGGSNMFLTKYDETLGSKIALGPLWDFDTVMKTEGEWSRLHNSQWFPFKWDDADWQFTGAYYNRLREVKDWLFDDMVQWADDFGKSATATGISQSLEYHNKLYYEMVHHYPVYTMAEQVSMIKEWFTNRKAFFEAQAAGVREVETAETVKTCYDLMGRRVQCPQSGQLIICGGRKMVWK